MVNLISDSLHIMLNQPKLIFSLGNSNGKYPLRFLENFVQNIVHEGKPLVSLIRKNIQYKPPRVGVKWTLRSAWAPMIPS
jgi:hypothetical protein